MEGQGVRIPAMEPNATDSPVDESPGVDATGHEATSRKRPDLVLDREGASNRSSDTGPEDPSLEGKPERSGPEELARAPKEGKPRPSLRIRPAREDTRGRDGAGTAPVPYPQESPRTNPRETRVFVEPPAQELTLPGRDQPTHPQGQGDRPGEEGTPAWGARVERARSKSGLQRSTTSGAGSQPQEPLPRQGRARCAEPVVCEDHTQTRADPPRKDELGGNSRHGRKRAEARPTRSRPARRTGRPDLRSDRRKRCSTRDRNSFRTRNDGYGDSSPDPPRSDLASGRTRRETLVEETRERRTAGGQRPQ